LCVKATALVFKLSLLEIWKDSNELNHNSTDPISYGELIISTCCMLLKLSKYTMKLFLQLSTITIRLID
jgi:hypothetical protein